MAIMRSQLKNERGFFFLHQDLNHGSYEPKASVLPMSFAGIKVQRRKEKRKKEKYEKDETERGGRERPD